jgi:DMSO/TMAO reductase YedYZ molybdopterin-dependent catalytic subunit
MQRTNLVSRTLLLGCLYALVASGQASPQQTAALTLVVKGDIPTQLSLSAEDLAKMPRETVSILEHDGSKGEYEGVPLREILKRAGAPIEKDLRGKALASYVLAQASDGYQVVFTLAEVAPEFANESILVADKRDGKPMSDHFGPLRLVCATDKVGARSVRMLKAIEVVRLQK